jgi:hypothetical protein
MSEAAAFKPFLAKFLTERREAFADQLVTQARFTPPVPGAKPLPDSDIKQMVYGFIGMLIETLETSDSQTRTFYMSTVMPGLKGAGTELPGMIAGSSMFFMRLTVAISDALPAEHRRAGVEWVSQFLADYLGDICKVWL